MLPRNVTDSDTVEDPDYLPIVSSKDVLQQQLTKSLSTSEKAWLKWRQDYLTKLRDTSLKHHRDYELPIEPKIDDVVLFEKENQPRGKWKLGIVESTTRNQQDNCIRSVTVRTTTGPPDYRRTTLTRSPKHLYPLESNIKTRARSIKLSPLLLCVMFFVSLINAATGEPIIMAMHCSNGLLDITS